MYIYKTHIRRLWKVERRRQTSKGPWDLRNDIQVSFLGFLFLMYAKFRAAKVSLGDTNEYRPIKA